MLNNHKETAEIPSNIKATAEIPNTIEGRAQIPNNGATYNRQHIYNNTKVRDTKINNP
ncbi:hypothetical protein ACF0H5_017949 [Mactra antiquata]